MVKSRQQGCKGAASAEEEEHNSNTQRRHSHTPSMSEEEGSDNVSDLEEFGTPIRSRIRFTAEQTRILEDIYQKNKRPSSETKQKLANRFETPGHRIQIWFQNRRAKEKKLGQGGTGAAHMPDSGPPSESAKVRSERGGSSISVTSGEASSSREPEKRQHRGNTGSTSNGRYASDVPVKSKKRRTTDEKEEGSQSPIQLRSDSQQRRRSQSDLPFYQGTNESGSFHRMFPPYIPTAPRRSDPGLLYQSPYNKMYYHAVPSPTMNPQDMIYNPPPYVALHEPYTPSDDQQLNMESSKYIFNGDNLDNLVEVSIGSRHHQQQLNESHTSSSGSNILVHDEEKPKSPVVEAENSSNTPRKGEFGYML